MGFDRCGKSNLSLQPEKYLWIEELHGLQIEQLSLILALPVASFLTTPAKGLRMAHVLHRHFFSFHLGLIRKVENCRRREIFIAVEQVRVKFSPC